MCTYIRANRLYKTLVVILVDELERLSPEARANIYIYKVTSHSLMGRAHYHDHKATLLLMRHNGRTIEPLNKARGRLNY